jgi:hypothetical protein
LGLPGTLQTREPVERPSRRLDLGIAVSLVRILGLPIAIEIEGDREPERE